MPGGGQAGFSTFPTMTVPSEHPEPAPGRCASAPRRNELMVGFVQALVWNSLGLVSPGVLTCSDG